MPPSSAKRLAGKVQAWNPSFTSIGTSIQDSIPRSSEEVKQKLRSWNKSLARLFGKGDSHSRDPVEMPPAAGGAKTRTSLDLVAARKAVAEAAKATKVPTGTESLERRHSASVVPKHNESKARESTTRLRDVARSVELNADASKPGAMLPDKVKRTSANARHSFPRSIHPTGTSRFRKINSDVPDAYRSHGPDREYHFKLQEASSHPRAAAAPVLRQSASASNLADTVFNSVKKLRRSASNISLRRKFSQSKLAEDPTPNVPGIPLRNSAPPAGRPNSIQRSYTSLNFVHPDKCGDFRKPPLESIAENSEYNQACSEVIRQDLIFALHDSRVCPPQAPPTPVKRLPFNHSRTSSRQHDSVKKLPFNHSRTSSRQSNSVKKQEKPSQESRRRISSQQSTRSSLTSIQLTEQLDRMNDMIALRNTINKARILQGVPPLLFYQGLCAEAKILAATYKSVDTAKGGKWATEMQLNGTSGKLQLVGPPHIGGKCTGKMWADGGYSRSTQSSHSECQPRDHKGCPCKNSKVWEAITDVRWLAIGLSCTDDEERWVAVLSE